MTYTPNVPVSGDSLGSTRDRIRENFQVINTYEAVNHVSIGAIGAGKHKFVQLPEVTASGAGFPSTDANEGAVYTEVGNNPAETNLWFRAENSGGGGGFKYQLTTAVAASTSKFGNNTFIIANNAGGWTFLPGGLILQYGRRLSPGSSGAITFPLAFPSGNAPFSIQVSLERATDDHNVIIDSGTTPTATGFNYKCDTGGSVAVNWIAIGK